MRFQPIRTAIILLLALLGGQASFGQERVPPSGTEARSNHDWLLACVLSYPVESTPVVLGQVTPESAREIARRTAESCEARLASTDGLARLSKIKIGKALVESAGRYPASTHLEWLTGCLMDFAGVRPGTRRSQLDGEFRTEGGISWPQHQHFYHRNCKYLQVGLEFGNADARRPENEVTAVEDVELDLMRAD